MSARNFLLIGIIGFAIAACSQQADRNLSSNEVSNRKNASLENSSVDGFDSSSSAANATVGKKVPLPKDVRGIFMLLPEDVFVIEGCEPESDRNCLIAKQKYLNEFLITDDDKNDFLEAGGGGNQTKIRMSVFHLPDGGALIGVNNFGKTRDSYKFYDFAGGLFDDVSLEVIPEYSSANIYEFSKDNSIIPVYAKRIKEQGADFEITEKGEQLYKLRWKNGEFSISR